MRRLSSELKRFMQPYPAHVRRTMLAARKHLAEQFVEASELIYDATAAVGVGYSYTADLRGLFVNLAAYAHHVNLVFMWGVRLTDPKHLLRGEGARIRHVRLERADDLGRPEFGSLLRQAEANAPRPATPVKPATVIKVYQGTKRRPKPQSRPA